MEFLLGVGFRMDAPFLEGVSYFSRAEEARARAVAVHRRNRENYPDIKINPGDTETIDFIKRVQYQVRVWMSKGMVRISPLMYRLSYGSCLVLSITARRFSQHRPRAS